MTDTNTPASQEPSTGSPVESRLLLSWEVQEDAVATLRPYKLVVYLGELEEEKRFELTKMFYFTMVPASAAEAVLGIPGGARPSGSHNDSPTAQSMVAKAKEWGGWVGGYCKTEGSLDGAYVDFDTLFVPLTVDQAALQAFIEETSPSEEGVDHENDTVFRMWWD